jgi:isopentenyl-diphosphate Delta-isomerase
MKESETSANEYFDVVDLADSVVGRRPRAEVHLLRLRHRAVHIFLFNEQGQVFLQKRSWTKDTSPGRWSSSCAGHVDSGETYDAAARRELAEELGVHEIRLERLFKIEACPETGEEFVWVYRGFHQGPFQLNPAEISFGQWLHPDDLEKQFITSPNLFAPSFVYVWKQFRQQAS